jgi:hypothetical protein
LEVVAFKFPDSDLRKLLKIFKRQFDDPALLRRYEPVIRRAVYLHSSQRDQPWRAEALHQLALLHQAEGELDSAEKFYKLSLREFHDHERLGIARTMRDYGLFIALHYDPWSGKEWVEKALYLLGEDVPNIKADRQKRITKSYLYRAQLLLDRNDTDALKGLVEFATTSRDCSLRDQHNALTFALPYVDGLDKHLLVARLIEINARRRKLRKAAVTMASLVIETELFLIRKFTALTLRKE